MKSQLKIRRQLLGLIIPGLMMMLLIQCQLKTAYKVDPSAITSKLDVIQKKSLSKYSLRSGGSDEDHKPTFKDTLSSAIGLSLKGNYKDSKNALLSLQKAYPENEEVTFQIAVQDYYLGNYAKSIERLSVVVRSTKKDLRQEAEFIMFHAATTLDDNFATAKKYLKLMAGNSSHPYHKDAKYQLGIMGE